jgi:hypothetical protein
MPDTGLSNLQKPARISRGPKPLPLLEKRFHCVSVRLNAIELSRLDELRGRVACGKWLRMAALDAVPASVPAINQAAWIELSRLAANLNQAQAAINRGEANQHQAQTLADLHASVSALRLSLLGVRL